MKVGASSRLERDAHQSSSGPESLWSRLLFGLAALAASAAIMATWADGGRVATWARLVLIASVAASCVVRGTRSTSALAPRRRAESEFWCLVGLAVSLWLGLAVIAPSLSTAPLSFFTLQVLWVCGAALFALASELLPDAHGPEDGMDRIERIDLAAWILFGCALLPYANRLPDMVAQSSAAGVAPGVILPAGYAAVVLEIWAASRFAYASRSATSRGWRRTYLLLSLAALLLLLSDIFDPVGATIARPGTWTNALGDLALVAIAVAASDRWFHLSSRSRVEGADRGPRRIGAALVLALSLPMAHLALYSTGALRPSTRPVRDLVVLGSLLILVALALLRERLVVAERRSLVAGQSRAEAELRASEELHRQLFESLPEAIVVERDGALLHANSRALALLRGLVAASSEHPQSSPDLVPMASDEIELEPAEERGLGLLLTLLQSRNEGGPFEHRVTDAEGTELDLEITRLETRYESAPATQWVVRDITALKKQREGRERTSRLAELGRVSATLAHEIRNPIGSIALNLRYLEESWAKPGEAGDRAVAQIEDRRETLSDLKAAVERLQGVARQILDFVRPEDSALQPLDLGEVIASQLSTAAREHHSDGVQLLSEIAPALPLVRGSRVQLVQLLGILLDNGREASLASRDEGGECVVRVSVTVEGECVLLAVEDRGGGIPTQDLEKVFEPFFTTRTRGTGLGLSIAQRIVERHAGRIAASSRSSGGCRIEVRLPSLECTEQTQRIERSEQAVSPSEGVTS